MSTPEDEFAIARAGMRETVKWLVGGVVTTAAGVLAGAPLTNIGELDWGFRMQAALLGAGLAYIAMGWVLWGALSVIESEPVSARYMADLKESNPSRMRRIENALGDRLPENIPTFTALMERGEALTEAARTGDKEAQEYAAFVTSLRRAMAEVAFHYKRDVMRSLWRRTFILLPVIIFGVGVFAWAANPPKRPPMELCDAVSRGAVLTATQTPSGIEFSAVPNGQNCKPFVLTPQPGRIYLAS